MVKHLLYGSLSTPHHEYFRPFCCGVCRRRCGVGDMWVAPAAAVRVDVDAVVRRVMLSLLLLRGGEPMRQGPPHVVVGSGGGVC
jgi:hypothetical protein